MGPVVLAWLTVGVLSVTEPPATQDARAEGALWAAISINRPIIKQQRLGQTVIRFALVNDGNKTIDPKLASSKLVVNGKEHWMFNLGLGPIDDRALPPGDHLFFTRGLGDEFKQPGVYKVSWKGKNFQSPEMVFRILPAKKK